jgi:hypothetical protein
VTVGRGGGGGCRAAAAAYLDVHPAAFMSQRLGKHLGKQSLQRLERETSEKHDVDLECMKR